MQGLEDDVIFKTSAPEVLRKTLVKVPVAIAVLEGFEFKLTYASEALFEVWGKDKSIVGKRLLEILPELKDQPFPELLRQVFISGETHGESEALAYVMKEGGPTEIYFDYSYSAIRDEDEAIIGVLVVANDVTDKVHIRQKQSETAKVSQQRQAILAAIVNSSDDTILSKTLEGIITSWNPAAERMFGYTEHEAIGQHISLLIPPDRLPEETHIIDSISKGIKIDHFETVRETKDGRLIDISLTVSPLRDEKGNVIGASKIARDITQQKINERKIKNYSDSLETINILCRSISEELDIQKLLQKVTDAATQVTGAEFGAFFYNTVNENGEAFMLYNVSGATREAFERFGMPRNTAVFHPTFAGEGTVRVDDITADSRYGKSAPHYGMPKGHLPVTSYLAVPVKSKTGEVIGGLFFGHQNAGVFGEDDEVVIEAIAAQAAIALDNAKLFHQVKAMNSKKDEFIGLASHELKTPLTSLTGYLQILKRTPLTDSQKLFLNKTLSQTARLTDLVSDMLDVSKIEAGKLTFSFQEFSFTKVLLDSVELIQLSAEQHQIVLLGQFEEILITGDAHRIEQVIINLLTNAIKYSPKADKVEVTLIEKADEVQMAVKDFGIGIPADKIFNLFSRFYRVDNLSPNMSGLGIGLYITKEIIDRHGGKIWVESVEGEGSTFWVSFPKTNKQ